ncbi:unnamed protein product [Cylicocyclus nassatus]|uniref:Uncharacterized protein n=1 Tax=Cylicocyclus nassatus TaxID=53992 RepID=A0AA36MA42_CYLNA|nr:unnamed protein product [Cylicocyclus nassatus]
MWRVFLLAIVALCLADQCTTVTETYGGLPGDASPEFVKAMENALGRKLTPDELLMKVIVSDRTSPKITVYGVVEANKITWEFDGPDMKNATRVLFFKPFEELGKCRPDALFIQIQTKPFPFEELTVSKQKI